MSGRRAEARALHPRYYAMHPESMNRKLRKRSWAHFQHVKTGVPSFSLGSREARGKWTFDCHVGRRSSPCRSSSRRAPCSSSLHQNARRSATTCCPGAAHYHCILWAGRWPSEERAPARAGPRPNLRPDRHQCNVGRNLNPRHRIGPVEVPARSGGGPLRFGERATADDGAQPRLSLQRLYGNYYFFEKF